MLKSVLTSLALLLATAAPAQSISELVDLEVLPGWRQADGSHIAGLRITLAPGWKTYWRAPGAAGIPPRFDFAGSRNIREAAPHFPSPEVFDQAGLTSVGYSREVVFPLRLDLDGDGPARLRGEIEIGVCAEICIPATLPFDAVLPEQGRRDGRLLVALADRPMEAAEAGIGPATCGVKAAAKGLDLALGLPGVGAEDHIVVELPDPDIWISGVEVERTTQGATARVGLQSLSGAGLAFDRSDLRITVIGPLRSAELRGCSAG